MIFCKVLFAFLAISAILAAPIPDENQSFTLEKRGRKGGVGSNPPINLGVWLPQFPVHAALPPPPPPVSFLNRNLRSYLTGFSHPHPHPPQHRCQ